METENRADWYKKAELWEKEFVKQFGGQLGLIVNPAKDVNPCAPDLYNLMESEAGDLKLLKQPFYKAEEKFGIPAQYCWTLNVGDIVNYAITRSDKFEIYVWQCFKSSKRYGVEIEEMNHIWFCDLHLLKDIVGRSVIHEYIRRVNDTKGNAYASHTIDIRQLRIVA